LGEGRVRGIKQAFITPHPDLLPRGEGKNVFNCNTWAKLDKTRNVKYNMYSV
jgi:hypothetical protein